MSQRAVFKGVYPIGDTDTNALPVKEIGPAVGYYTQVLGFSLVAKDRESAVLSRDDVRIGLAVNGRDPEQASCYFDVSDVEALRARVRCQGHRARGRCRSGTRGQDVSRLLREGALRRLLLFRPAGVESPGFLDAPHGGLEMGHDPREMKFLATPEKGEVSALLVRPDDASHLLVLGHGASTNMRHATLQTIAERMADAGIATFRYNFPYMEHGKGRDSQAVCTATVRSAVAAAHEAAPDLPLLAGGHSFGGRMTSTAASESPLDGVRGLVFFAFPLHQPGKPDTKRADHLGAVTVPMLFLSGTRDELADLDLLQPVCKKLGKSRDAPPPGHGRPRIPHPQALPQERGGCLRRDGPRRPGLGVPIVSRRPQASWSRDRSQPGKRS